MKKMLSFTFVLLGFFFTFNEARILDTNFIEEVVLENSGIRRSTSLEWAPDDSKRIFITLKSGKVMIVKDDSLLSTPFATINPVYTGSECGLLSVAFDPDYATNNYVYFFVTVSNNEQQIIRYTDNNNVGTEKTVIVKDLPTTGNNHDGGMLLFGPDKKIYWAIGDNGSSASTSTSMNTLRSKVGRANSDGSVPTDNPFYDDGDPNVGNNDYIWAKGFRNPFTGIFHPITGNLWLNVVGSGYEQVFRVKAGDDGGWPRERQSGLDYISPVIAYRTNSTFTLTIQSNGASRTNNVTTFSSSSNRIIYQGERITISGVTPSSFNGDVFVDSVISVEPTVFTAKQNGVDESGGGGSGVTMSQGGCISGGVFYNHSAYAQQYQGNFFYGDYNSGEIFRATLNQNYQITRIDKFSESSRAIDITVGRDGMLYYIPYSGSGRLFRAKYTGQVVSTIPLTETKADRLPDVFNTEKLEAFLKKKPLVQRIDIRSLSGKLVHSFDRKVLLLHKGIVKKLKISLPKGLYVMSAVTSNVIYQRKIMILR